MLTRFFVDIGETRRNTLSIRRNTQAKTPPLHYGLRFLDYKQEKQNGYESLCYPTE